MSATVCLFITILLFTLNVGGGVCLYFSHFLDPFHILLMGVYFYRTNVVLPGLLSCFEFGVSGYCTRSI